MQLRCSFLALGMAAGLLAQTVRGADERLPLPSGTDVEKAQSAVREVFKSEYAKTKAADRIALAAKLFSQAQETKNDPASKFVLLRESRDLAAKGSDPFGVVRAADMLSLHFTMDFGDALVPAAAALVASTQNGPASKQIAEVLLAMTDEVRFAGDWEASQTILKAAAAAAAKAPSASLQARLRSKTKDVAAGRAEAVRFKEVTAILKNKPDDPSANAAAGRFLAFYQQEWAEGIPLLARGSDAKLRSAAERDLKAGDSDEARLAAADAWFDLAATADADVKPAMQIRAYHWYAAAFPNLSGIAKVRIEKRLDMLVSTVEARADRTALWQAVRRGIGDGRLNRARIVGGGFYKDPFEEIPAAGGILIGFTYTVSPNKSPNVIQPIYLTAYGEHLGPSRGIVGKKDSPRRTMKAKPGYAVGALNIRSGGGLNAFQPVFMRIVGTGLNTNDSYEGPFVGGMGGVPAAFGGDGQFIVGLHGKANDRGRVGTMSTISLTSDATPQPRPQPIRKKKK